MSEVAIGTILLFASLAVLMFIRIPIAFSLAASALITAAYLGIPFFNLSICHNLCHHNEEWNCYESKT